MSTSTLTTPTTGLWAIDASHSSVEATVRHLMVSKVRGRFTVFSGKLDIGEDLTQASVEVTIDAASIDTGDAKRDEHLRSADFLDAEQFPSLTFVSTKVVANGDQRYAVTGDLTIHGTTREVVLDTEYLGVVQDPWGNAKAAFTAATSFDREDFGITWNAPLEAGGVLVAKKVDVTIEIQAAAIS